jgi:hypothetical protein
MIHTLRRMIFCGVFFGSAHALAAQTSYQVVPVVNGGTITGTVKWTGPLPHLTALPITKDTQICDPQGQKTRDLERLVVGPQNGVANTVVYLKNISSGKAFDFPPERRTLDQKQCRYEPHIMLIPKDNLLNMKSSDPTLHTIHMDGAATYNLPFPFTDQVISRPMNNAGLVNLKCNGGHVWMNAEAMVAPHPYYAVTDETGKFELSGVPSGQYEVVAWHEGWHVARTENTFDVLTERRVNRPVFSEPRTWTKATTVTQDGTTVLNFVISEK